MIAGELGVLAMLVTTPGESLVLLRQRRPDMEGSRRAAIPWLEVSRFIQPNRDMIVFTYITDNTR